MPVIKYMPTAPDGWSFHLITSIQPAPPEPDYTVVSLVLYNTDQEVEGKREIASALSEHLESMWPQVTPMRVRAAAEELIREQEIAADPYGQAAKMLGEITSA